MELIFDVSGPAEPAAGLRGFNDEVKVTIGDWALSDPEVKQSFIEDMRQLLRSCFDTNYVLTREESLIEAERMEKIAAAIEANEGDV
jgi:hypothetical protein